VPTFTGQSGATELHSLDQILPPGSELAIRFRGEKAGQSLLAPVSLLQTSSQSPRGRVEIQGPPAEDSEARILFFSSARALSGISALLQHIAESVPGAQPHWIGVPVSAKNARPSEIRVLGSAVRQAGTLVLRDKKKKVASFGLYPLKQEREPAPELQPVRKIVPEPKGNLRARAQWFQRRSGGR
jgi:hypothetical protein